MRYLEQNNRRSRISDCSVCCLYLPEHGDLNVVIFGAILYLPYVAILCLYNGVTIALLERINERQKWMNYFLPIVPLLIWFFLSAGSIKIRYSNSEDGEFFVGVFFASLNLSSTILYYSATLRA